MIARGPGRVDIRRVAAVTAGKLTGLTSRALGRGGGTALPGVVADRLDPDITRDLSRQLPCGALAVSGTNGKTTTCRILSQVLRDAGYQIVRNSAGSNLMRGVTTSLVERARLSGNMPNGDRSLGLFEVDEAALPALLSAVEPRGVLLLDLFRDQLDRYGEVATVARLWSLALSQLPATAMVVVNADDPLLADASVASVARPTFFGIASAETSQLEPEHSSDVKACPHCGGHITYSAIRLGHLGLYRCVDCSFSRPEPDVSAHDVRLTGATGSSFLLRVPAGEASVTLPLPGLYNVYNALAAAALAVRLGVSVANIAASLRRVTPAFGRMERLQIEGREVVLALAKNPAGLNEVLRTALSTEDQLHLMLMLNDNTADGHDVSWIWDADVEMLAGHVASLVASGTRGADMALRCKYAGLLSGGDVGLEVILETEPAFRRALALTPSGGRLFLIPTYTALLDIRTSMSRLGYVEPYWEQ